MARPKKPMPWIPLDVAKWLNGSTREELNHDERAIWIDMLCLAARYRGLIGANPDDELSYSLSRLAGILYAKEELVERTIDKCIKVGKLERLDSGILKVIKWDEYQLSDGYRRKLEAETAPIGTETAPNERKPAPYNKKENKKENKNKKDIKDIAEPKTGSASSQRTSSVSTASNGRKEASKGGDTPNSPSTPPSKASKRKPYHEWTDEEIIKANPIDQCQAVWDRGYFRLTGHAPVRDYAKDGRLFKLMLTAGWDVQKWVRQFLIHVTEKDEELGGYTVGVLKAWVTRQDARKTRDKREESERRSHA